VSILVSATRAAAGDRHRTPAEIERRRSAIAARLAVLDTEDVQERT
jgi:hypothetical protein